MALRHKLENALDQAVEEGEFPDRKGALAAAIALLDRPPHQSELANSHLADGQDAASLVSALFRSTVSVAIVVTDLPGNVVAWNEGAVRLMGWTFREMEGQSAAIFFTEEDRARSVHHLEMLSALETGSAPDERWHVKKNGSRFWGSGVMTPLLDEEGKAQGFIKVVQERAGPAT